MKTKAISSFFVLFAIAAGMVAMTPAAFADQVVKKQQKDVTFQVLQQ
jgi:site-specific recombinase